MEIHPGNRNEVAWTSWMPALGYALARSTGPVLEIGVGHFSTPFLHYYCKGAGRDLDSMESDHGWCEQFRAHYEGPNHTFFGPNDQCVVAPSGLFGVVFIDNSCGKEGRLAPFLRFINNAEFVVVHDYHRENYEVISPHLGGVNHKIFASYDPPTLLASKLRDIAI